MTAVAPTTALQTWHIDPTHSAVSFAVRHMMFATVRGQFGDVSGSISMEQDDPRTTAVDVSIGTASIDTRMPQRDAHLTSPDFFDAATFPTATFAGRGATANGDGSWALGGTLTIRGVSKPVVLQVRPLGTGNDPWGKVRSAWTATVTIDRREFGLNWNQALEAGGVLVATDVDLTLDIQAVQG